MTEKFPEFIEDLQGNVYVLADSEQDARAEAENAYGDTAYDIEYVGWMGRVPYPDGYESREEWERSLDFHDDWWEKMQPPVNDKQRVHLKQAWVVRDLQDRAR